MERELSDQQRYTVLILDDKALLQEIFSVLTRSVNPLANPYSDDGSYAAAISHLPVGLRAMAATHHLDVSLTLDDIGWHFLNFGERNFVRETEAGLRELGLGDLAEWFAEAFEIINPLLAEINACGSYYECLTKHGGMNRINELTQKALAKEAGCRRQVRGSPIYDAWIKYARKHPENVFGS